MARTKKSPVADPSTPPTETNEGGGDLAALGIDEVLDGLEHVVQQLEAGDLPLEQALQRFERGVRLARHGSMLLDTVEERVEQLLADREQAVALTEESQ